MEKTERGVGVVGEVRRIKLWKGLLLVAAACLLGCDAEAADKVRLGILGFGSGASGVSDRQAEMIADKFTSMLYGSKSIAVYERQKLAETVGKEIRIGASGLVDPETAAEIGRVAGVQYLLSGTVTELSRKTTGVNVLGIGDKNEEVRVAIDVRVVDTATAEVCLALTETGFSRNSTTNIFLKGIGSYERTGFDGLEELAISDAVHRLCDEIRDSLGGEHSYVIGVKDKSYTIDAGATKGVKVGSLYLVYVEGQAIRGLDNEIIGKEKIPLAMLKVRAVENGYSDCVVAPPSNGKLIRRGDKIEPISSAEARRVAFASNRAPSSGQRPPAAVKRPSVSEAVPAPTQAKTTQTQTTQGTTSELNSPSLRGKIKFARIRYKVPPLARSLAFKIELVDPSGTRVILDRGTRSGEYISIDAPYSQECVVTIYLGGEFVWQDRYM
ncbi:MAG: CsgG/HfaB family protein [Synergistaceae bacterium]|jgi:curli biogenesis system outer membrane secretion channel CsgG|nr:CsgG/HfaB family protein [Synergistaceae bacterium]